MAKAPVLTLKQAQTLLQKTTKRLAELDKELDRFEKQVESIVQKETRVQDEWCKVEEQQHIAKRQYKTRLAEKELAKKLKNLPAGKCVFDRRTLQLNEEYAGYPIRFPRTYFNNTLNGYIAINSKGKEQTFSNINDAKRWASDKPPAIQTKAIDIAALNQVIGKAGFRVVRK